MVSVLVPEDKLVGLSPKSSKGLYSILCSLQSSGIFLLKNLKWQDTILILFYPLLSYFSFPVFSLLKQFLSSPLPAPTPTSREEGTDKLGNSGFYFPNPKPWREEKIYGPRESDLNKHGG